MRKRVVITGMGATCSAGNNVKEITESILNGIQSFSLLERPHLSHLKAKFAGLVKKFDIRNIANNKLPLYKFDKYVQFAYIAAKESLQDAKIDISNNNFKIGLVLGTCSGPMQSIEEYYKNIFAEKILINKEELFKLKYYSCAKILAHIFKIQGPIATVVTACSSGTAAFGIAADLIRLGICDVVLTGGSDTLSETTLIGFDGLKATAAEKCAPFSLHTGLNLGEGAGFCVLESIEHAQKRNAKIYAEILGFGLSNDAYHCTSPDPTGTGQSLAMKRALDDFGILKENITYINAHGTGTEPNDKAETKAIIKIFGDMAYKIPVSSIKSEIGHCLGAAGSLETIVGIAGMNKGIFPPTANFNQARQGCTLDYIPQKGRKMGENPIMLKNNFAFGGNNASIIISKEINSNRFYNNQASSDKIVITGIGLVSRFGAGNTNFIEGITYNKNIFSNINIDDDLTKKQCLVPDFNIKNIYKRIETRNFDRASVFATAATCLSLQHANIFESLGKNENIGLFLNLSNSTLWAEEEHIKSILKNNYHISHLTAFPFVVPNSIAGNICQALQIKGHNTTLCFGPGAGLFGLGFAVFALKNNHTNLIVSVSVDEISNRAIKDYYTADFFNYKNILFSEGACAFTLETDSHANNRNAKILAEICSIEYSTETSDYLNSDFSYDILKETIKKAIDNAGIFKNDIEAICCNKWNNKETKAISCILGENICIYDLSEILGFAEANSPVFSLSYLILNKILKSKPSKKYILSVFNSFMGTNCACVIKIL